MLCASVQPEEFSREGSLCVKKLKKRRQTLGRPSQAQFQRCAGHRNNDGCALCRQNHQRCEPGQSTGGAAHEIPGGVEYENGASARPDRLTDIACNIISAKQMVTVGLQYIGKHPESNSRPVAVVLREAFEGSVAMAML